MSSEYLILCLDFKSIDALESTLMEHGAWSMEHGEEGEGGDDLVFGSSRFYQGLDYFQENRIQVI